MAKIAYPAVEKTAYAASISMFRQYLTEMATFLQNSPGAADDLLAQVNAALGIVGITAGQLIDVFDASDSHAPSAAVIDGNTVSAGLVSSDKIVKTNVKYTAPAITGTYTNGYTFTITNGQITGIVAS